MTADDDAWKILRSEMVIETPYLRLRRDEVELPGGRRIDDYYVRESHGFSVAFALTPDDRVVLVRQYKHGVGQGVLELPAGAIDEGESAAACAARELAEETGFAGAAPDHLGTFLIDPTHSDGRFHLFLVRDARRVGEQRLDPTEKIDVEFATLDELRAYLRDGTIDASAHVASAYVALERLGRLA